MNKFKLLPATLLLVFGFISHAYPQQTVLVEHVYFDSGKYELSDKAKDLLDNVFNKVKSFKEYQIEINGNTDSIGSEKYNLDLSLKRANATRNYFLSKQLKDNAISLKGFGEKKPIVINNNDENRQRNRRVEIVIKYSKFVTENEVKIDTFKTTKVFENDTSIYCMYGTQIIIPAGAFYPRKISEINFNIQEVYDLCTMINGNVTTQTTNGDCITSGGMLFIKPMIMNDTIQPNKGKFVKFKIPAVNNFLDKEMKIYMEERTKKGELKWKEIPLSLSFDSNNNKYYVFETDVLTGFNIDKPIKLNCEKTAPIVKINGFEKSDLFLTYKKENYLSKGTYIKKHHYSIVDVNKTKVPVLTILAYKKGFAYLAKGPVNDLTFKTKKNTYIVKKKYFKKLGPEYQNSEGMMDFLCSTIIKD